MYEWRFTVISAARRRSDNCSGVVFLKKHGAYQLPDTPSKRFLSIPFRDTAKSHQRRQTTAHEPGAV